MKLKPSNLQAKHIISHDPTLVMYFKYVGTGVIDSFQRKEANVVCFMCS